MQPILLLHVTGGAVGLLAGFAALYSAKGGRLHRRSGQAFVYAMLCMALSGAFIAAVTAVRTSVVMGLFAAYLVFTGWTTVLPARSGLRMAGGAAAALAGALAIALALLGARALHSPGGVVEGMPAPMAFVFAGVALTAAISDVRVLRGRELRGRSRLSRHLWRMCFALFIAAASFFLGQSRIIPEPIRIPGLLAVPVLVPLLAMLLWLWRTRVRRALPTVIVSDAA